MVKDDLVKRWGEPEDFGFSFQWKHLWSCVQEFKPLIFQNGKPVPFPEPTKAGLTKLKKHIKIYSQWQMHVTNLKCASERNASSYLIELGSVLGELPKSTGRSGSTLCQAPRRPRMKKHARIGCRSPEGSDREDWSYGRCQLFYKGCVRRDDDAFWFQEEAEPADRGS